MRHKNKPEKVVYYAMYHSLLFFLTMTCLRANRADLIDFKMALALLEHHFPGEWGYRLFLKIQQSVMKICHNEESQIIKVKMYVLTHA